jgi:predicted nicotinamide N-methyase
MLFSAQRTLEWSFTVSKTLTGFLSSTDHSPVFDLPQLHARPTALELLDTLDILKTQAPSWDRGDKSKCIESNAVVKKPQVAPEGVTNYLTSIIASQLRWIKDDEQKEVIWEAASLRLAERSGRTAMPAISRTFTILTQTNSFDLSIYEPSLTGDSLGFKTWAASFLLSRRLKHIDLPRPINGQLRALELGSGTGLVGMALAGITGASVLLTDLPEIESNLVRNVEQNVAAIIERGGQAQTAILDWTSPSEIIMSTSSTEPGLDAATLSSVTTEKFPLVVAADSIYSAEHPDMLVGAIKTWLAPGSTSRVVMEMPRREGYEAELNDLKTRMLQLGLRVLDEGEETGYDDWGGSGEDELQEVNCWWSVWGWATT